MPLFAVVSRLTNQKGLDLVLEALPGLLEQGGQLALLGAGDPVLQEGFLAAAAEHRAGWRTDRLSRSFLASHYGRRGRYSGAQSFRTVRLNAVIWLKVWHAASGAAYRGWPIRSPTVRWKIWRTVSPAVLSSKTVTLGRCYARFGVLCVVVTAFALAVCTTAGDGDGF